MSLEVASAASTAAFGKGSALWAIGKRSIEQYTHIHIVYDILLVVVGQHILTLLGWVHGGWGVARARIDAFLVAA